MSPIRLQQLEHPLIGPARLARERPTHGVGEVEVADRDRVGVTERRPRDLGRRPGAHAPDGEEPCVRLIQGEGRSCLDAGRLLARGPDGLGAPTFDAPRVEREVRRLGESFRVGRKVQPELARGGLAGREHHRSVRPPGLDAGDLLLQDRRDERVHHGAGSRDAHTSVAAPEHFDHVVLRLEAGVVVEGADQPGDRIERPGGTRSPRLGQDVVAEGSDAHRRGSVGRPHRAVGVREPDPHRRIAGTAAQWEERLRHVDRELRRDRSLRHGRRA